jgi:hypothetical protein
MLPEEEEELLKRLLRKGIMDDLRAGRRSGGVAWKCGWSGRLLNKALRMRRKGVW